VTFTEDKWLCDIKRPNCTKNATANWMCKVEQVQCSACPTCYAEWRQDVSVHPDLAVRCPRCAQTPDAVKRRAEASKNREPVKTDRPLEGMIADAIEAAMFREGILVDVRRKVLVRLAREEPWLHSPKTVAVG
jgi:hypothetical protein